MPNTSLPFGTHPGWRVVLPAIALGLASAAPAPTQAEQTPGALPPPVTPACVSSPFGPRTVQGPRASSFHNGIDIPAPAGAWVRAVAAGQVVSIRRRGASGLEVSVKHAEGFVTRYAHLGTVTPRLASGQRTVARGDPLGRVGRTGITYGTHVHLEVVVNGVATDPAPFFRLPRCGAMTQR